MHHITYPTIEPTFFIAYTGNQVFHYGTLTSLNCMDTGQEFLEIYTDEILYRNRAEELGFEIKEELQIEE
jgi:hypothetical protein